MTFYPFADENSIVSSYFIVERGLFVVIYKKKEARSFEGITEKKESMRTVYIIVAIIFNWPCE